MTSSPASGSPSPGPGPAAPIPDDDQDEANEQQLTMAASVILTNLPRNAYEALEGAGDLAQAKVTIRLQPVGSAPALRQRVFKITSTQRFSAVVGFLRKKLGLDPKDSVFCYVNSVFAPGLDEVVGNLWRASTIAVSRAVTLTS